MYLYITLDEAANKENSVRLINKKINCYNIEFMGSYISRGYETLIYKTNIADIQFNNIKSILKDENHILEIDKYIKYYYGIKSSIDAINVNNNIKKILSDNGYEFKLSRSHSQNGELFMLLKILNINPLDKEELTNIQDKIEAIEGINQFIEY